MSPSPEHENGEMLANGNGSGSLCRDLTPQVQAFMAEINWGEDYPAENIILTSREEEIVHMHSWGVEFEDISDEMGISENALRTAFALARAKQELSESRDKSVSELSYKAKQVLAYNELFGAGRWPASMLRSSITRIYEGAMELDELMPQWRQAPVIGALSLKETRDRIMEYDEKIGPLWRHSPSILGNSHEAILNKIEMYDELFGESWRMRPALLTNSIRTVVGSHRALKALDITPDNTGPSIYFGLVLTTVNTKRKKINHIRRKILGHTHVRTQTSKMRISELAALGPFDAEFREAEAEEIDELKKFILRLGKDCLYRSIKAIDARAEKVEWPPETSL